MYRVLAQALAYPTPATCETLGLAPETLPSIEAEYDRLFRAGGIWLEGVEYGVENEFHRTTELADIQGFYRAFGVKPNSSRPDALPCMLEFMCYLEFKRARAHSEASETGAPDDRATICVEAQETFFRQHLGPAMTAVADRVASATAHPIYRDAAEGLQALFEQECARFGTPRPDRLARAAREARGESEWRGCAAEESVRQ